jgi:predicted acylesterase/phospholipase RssA
MPHPVLVALRKREPGERVALVVEGGGMRGAVSGGMALALEELGLSRAFDAAYGSSAGALNAMWLVSGRVSRRRSHVGRSRAGAGAHQAASGASRSTGGRRPHADRAAL